MRVRYPGQRPPTGLMRRRENIANAEARGLVGIWYGILCLHVDPLQLKHAADWKGIIETLSLELRRYADTEAGRLLAGDGREGRPIR